MGKISCERETRAAVTEKARRGETQNWCRVETFIKLISKASNFLFGTHFFLWGNGSICSVSTRCPQNSGSLLPYNRKGEMVPIDNQSKTSH